MKKRLSPVLIFAGIVNLILFFTKFYVGVRTNSLCIYTDSINNLTDTLSLCLALIGVAFLSKPATERFRHGFGKMEDITTFIMSIVMTAAGCGFAYNSLGRLMTPVPVWFFSKYAIVIAVTCFVKLVLGIVFALKYKKEHSLVLKTVMLDSFLDCAITAITLISFTLSNTVGFALDAILGLVISVIIGILGVRLIVSSVAELIGQHNNKIELEIINTIKDIDKNIVINDIIIHTYGIENAYATLNLSLADCEKNFTAVQNTIKNRLKTDLKCNSVVEWEVFS